MKPGSYKLVRDVQNPKPDKRSQDTDWRAALVWKAGTQFVVTKEDRRNDESNVLRITKVGARNYQYITVNPDLPDEFEQKARIKLASLVLNWEPIEEDLRCLLERLEAHSCFSLTETVQKLVDTKKITLADIEAAHAAWEAEDETTND